ncbi:MAG TPA: MFS transporter, partial [Tepidiformaceae bacterium]|nr:MFS transporter [Tepidiformaceae bacterium]
MNRGAFRYRDFRLLLAGGALVGFVMPMQFLTQIFWIQDRYPDREVLYVSLVAASRGSAMLLFGLLGGAIADRFERRLVLFGCQAATLVIHALVALLMVVEPLGSANIAALLALTFLAAGAMSIDQPARTASTPAIVGMKDLSNGVSLQMFAQQITFPLSLPLVGFLNEWLDAGTVYSLTLIAWVFILPLILMMRYRSRGEGNRGVGVLRNIGEGLRYTRRDTTIFAVITIVVAIQVLGMPGPATLGPVWMTKILGLSPTQFGFMAMTWGLGTLTASIFYLYRSDLPTKGIVLWLAAAGFAVGAIVFAHSRFIPLTAVANFGLGFCMVSTMVSASTISQHVVSEEMRGRVMGLFPLAMGLQMLGGLPIGIAGQALGLPLVFPILAWTALAAVLVVMVIQPGLRLVGRRAQPQAA